MTPIVDLPKAEQQLLLNAFKNAAADNEKRRKLETDALERVEDLKDLSFKILYREVGDGAVAKMAHINSLARRLSELEGTNDGFLPGPKEPIKFESAIKSIATPGDIGADEEFLVAKKAASV